MWLRVQTPPVSFSIKHSLKQQRQVSALIPGGAHIETDWHAEVQGRPDGEILLSHFVTHFIFLSDKKTIRSVICGEWNMVSTTFKHHI